MNYLFNSNEIKKQLTSLFSGGGEKWAIVAFVGYNALDHLPSQVSELSVVCWPHAGGTNPDGVRRLMDNGIKVHFCENLHHKIYWRQGAGLIVGSANLSDNGLGDGSQHEFSIYCDDKNFDINEVLKNLELKPDSDYQKTLYKLDVEHAAQERWNGKSDNTKPRISLTFPEADKTEFPRKWKLVTWIENRVNEDFIRDEIKANFNRFEWDDDIDIKRDSSFEVGDFVLTVKTDKKNNIKTAYVEWLIVDHIIKSEGEDTWVLAQVKELDASSTPPPFAIDFTFKKHLKKAFNDAFKAPKDFDEIYDKTSYLVKPSFIAAIKNLYEIKS